MKWPRLFQILCLALATALVGPAAAQAPPQRPVLVELYTSQGCDSCRRANRFLDELDREGGIITLTFPVDYWDYLGWRDTFAHRDFTRRQRAFWNALDARNLYTPGIVMNGARHVNGAREDGVRAALRDARAAPAPPGPRLAIARVGSRVRIEVSRAAPPPEPLDIWTIAFEPGPVWALIGAGDNRGYRVAHYNLARSIRQVGEWNGDRLILNRAPCARDCVVVLQAPNGGPVIAAARTPPRD